MEFQPKDFLITTTTIDAQIQSTNDIRITRKVMIFTRTSSLLLGLNEQSKYRLLGSFLPEKSSFFYFDCDLKFRRTRREVPDI